MGLSEAAAKRFKASNDMLMFPIITNNNIAFSLVQVDLNSLS